MNQKSGLEQPVQEFPSRYVVLASQNYITVRQMRLRWLETSEAHSNPLHAEPFETGLDTHTQDIKTYMSRDHACDRTTKEQRS